MSHGTSRSRTDGTSETPGHQHERDGRDDARHLAIPHGGDERDDPEARPVTPDEIGQVFARIDDRAASAYPGLALVVISGARPVPLRRVNYYEDFQFMGLFDPHPDYPFIGPKELTVDAGAMGRNLMYFGESGLDLRMGEWSVTAGQMVAAGDPVAVILLGNGTCRTKHPGARAGMIAAVQRRKPRSGRAAVFPPVFRGRRLDDGPLRRNGGVAATDAGSDEKVAR